MKPIKRLGLAALAMLMALAFVGVSSAMAEATALCTEDVALLPSGVYEKTDECSSAKRVSHVHETTLAGAKAKLATPSGTVECDVLFLGDVKSANNLGSPLVIKGNFTYSNCNCIVEEENGPSEIKVLREGHERAKVTGEGLVHVVCSGFFSCHYVGVELIATARGPLLSNETNGEVSLINQNVAAEEPFLLCPDEARLTITTTPLVKVYLGA